MKNIQKLTPFILITFLMAYPSKTDFSNAFIKVAKEWNPTVVSIVSEKNIEPKIQEEEIKKSAEVEYTNHHETKRAKNLYEQFLRETITPDTFENREQIKEEFNNWLKENKLREKKND